jgi:hypothetical protein
MHPLAGEGIRILYDQHQAPGLGRNALDVQGRTDILAVAGVFIGDIAVLEEGGAVHQHPPGFPEQRISGDFPITPEGGCGGEAKAKGGRFHVPSLRSRMRSAYS